MDAAHTLLKKTALFLATALLIAAPGRAQTFNLNSSAGATATVSPTPGNAATVTVASSLYGTTEITFTTAVNYGSDPSWLVVTASGATTPATLTIAIGGTAGQLSAGLHTATVTLASGSITSAVITVNYTAGGSGSGTGTITPYPSTVAISAAAGGAASTTVTLTTTSISAVSFGFTPSTNSGGSWLGATVNTYTVSSTVYATLTIQASAGVLANGIYYGSVLITPTSGGATSTIYVTFTVGTSGGTGNLTASPTPISWSFTTGSGVYPSGQAITLSDTTGATYYTASVNPSNSWLYANGSPTTTSGYFTSGSATITLSPAGPINSLATGSQTGLVYVQDSGGNTVTLTVNLVVNGGSTTGITWSPNPVTLTAAVSGSTVQQTVSLTSTTAGTFTGLISGSGLYLGAVNTTSTTTASVIVYGNPSALAANTYSGSLSVTLTPTSGSAVIQSIPVSFVVGSGGGGSTAGIVTPSSLAFAYQTGTTPNSTSLPSQNIMLTGTGTFTTSVATNTSQTSQAWLTVSPATGSAPGAISVSVVPAGLGASATPYTGTVTVTTTSGVYPVSVSCLVTASPVLVAYPGSLNFAYATGVIGNPSANLYLNASDNSAMALTVATTTSWLTVSAPGGPTTNTTVSVFGNNLSSLANGVYTGTVTATATGAANSPVNVPVVLTVTGSTVSGSALTLGSSSLTFYAQQSGTVPASQTLSVSASSATSYTAAASSTGNWLTISPTGSLVTTSNPSLTVSVNQLSLTAANSPYYGTITFVANSVTQTVSVTLVVSTGSTGGTGNVTVTANNLAGTPSLNFGTYQMGGSTPTAQTLQVVSVGTASVSFTVSSSATWLSAGVTNGTTLSTPVTGLTVAIVNPSTLATGPYTAYITITPNGGTVVSVPVSLTVTGAPTVTATPTTLAFSYQAGNANPSPATVSVSGGGASLAFSALVTSGSNWLSVSPASGTTPTTGTAALTVTATPGMLGASAIPYSGTIVVSGTGTATGSTTINVTLTVTAPLPTIASVVNAASYVRGAVSPGELVTIFGTSLGPSIAAYAFVDPSTGKLATTIGGVQVLFNGIAAPMIYASSTQVSAMVPYEMAPIASPSVWIKYVGQTSNAVSLTSATTAPGLFAQNAQGFGPGSILNQDYSLNGPGNPAAKGSTVMVYMTGEGQTNPAGVTGAITAPTLPPPQVTPKPLLAIGVLINGQPAFYTYAGEAPGFATGLMQLNVQIPSTALSGDLSIIVSIGANISQSTVTVSVR
jgi:uncharacterized protein (TIGR03437 family)